MCNSRKSQIICTFSSTHTPETSVTLTRERQREVTVWRAVSQGKSVVVNQGMAMGEGLYWKGLLFFFKEIWKGCVNSIITTHVSQATMCALNADLSNLFSMPLNALLMSRYPYTYGSMELRVWVAVSSSVLAWRNVTLHCWAHLRFIEVLQALHVASRWWHHALLLFLLVFLFSLSLIVLLHISADFAKPPRSSCPNENTRHSSPAQNHTHVLLPTQLITQSFLC